MTEQTWEWTVEEAFEVQGRYIIVTGVRAGAVQTGDAAIVRVGADEHAVEVVGIEHMHRLDGGNPWGLCLRGITLDQLPVGAVVRGTGNQPPTP